METAGRCGVAPCVNMCQLLRGLCWDERLRTAPPSPPHRRFYVVIRAEQNNNWIRIKSSAVVVFPWPTAARLNAAPQVIVRRAQASHSSTAPLCFPVYIRHVYTAVLSASLSGCWLVGALDQWGGAPRRGWADSHRQSCCRHWSQLCLPRCVRGGGAGTAADSGSAAVAGPITVHNVQLWDKDTRA